MCGVCGFIGKGGVKDLKRMMDALAHRGPDDQGMWCDPSSSVFIGHRRLSILDIAGGGQPMWTSDHKLCVVFNGEIYNHMDLRHELKRCGYHFQTDHSDTEVLLHGYRKWGVNLPERLNGMWAFAIFDRTRNQIFISRDRFGKKPIFYTHQNNTFVFASELNALTLHSAVNASFSKRSLQKYFAYGYIPAPLSIYQSIYKLPGGTNLLFDIAHFSINIRKYWDFLLTPSEAIPIPKDPERVWGEQLRELLRRAVRRRLTADVPLGVFLSGGIDSSSITAFASEVPMSNGLQTFSIGFHEKSFDESHHARRIAETFHTQHYHEVLSLERAKRLLPGIVSRLDEPLGDASLLPTYLLCRETRKHVKVALGGDGGDELFAGYDPFKALRLAESFSRWMPRPVHIAIRMMVNLLPVSHRNISLDFKLKRTLKGLSFPKHLWNPVWMGPGDPYEIGQLFREPVDPEDLYSEAVECWESCPHRNLVDKTLQFFTRLYLQDGILAKVDRAGMMNSLEVRSPFLDIELVDFVRKIPYNFKYRHGETKYILKRAMEPILPRNTVYRKKKGFGIPVGKWFKHDVLGWHGHRLPAHMDEAVVGRLKREHTTGKKDHRLLLWNTWVLGGYIKNAIDPLAAHSGAAGTP